MGEALDALEADILSVIEKHRKSSYQSLSGFQSIPTGNRYQTLGLRGEALAGYRERRPEHLAKIKFNGCTVLDIGCNTGELSRIARREGALLVDGFDYDPFWIAIGRLVNAYNEETRISLYTADATDPSTYSGQYDIVLAFSVYPYLQQALSAVASCTRRLLLLETHELSHEGAESRYIAELEKYFPAHRILGKTDMGAQRDGHRLLIAFARSVDVLQALVRDGAGEATCHGGAPKTEYRRLDVSGSKLGYLAAFQQTYQVPLSHGLEKLLSHIENVDLSSFSERDRLNVASGVGYWTAFLKGYLLYRRNGGVSEHDPFVDHVTSVFRDKPFDEQLRPTVEDPDRLRKRVALRYEDVSAMREARFHDLLPVTIVGPGAARNGLVLVDADTGEAMSCERFDGYHRMFAARVCGVATLPYVFQRSNGSLA